MPLCRPDPELGVRGVDRGTHYLFCGGRLVVGPDYKSLVLSTTLIVVPTVIFFIFVVPYIGSHLSWAFPAVSIALVAFVFAMLFMTAFRDPGFYPRSAPNSDVEFGLAPSTREYEVNGYTVTTKYCSTCCHYRPPRCSHCAVCDNCVDKFDHHCPWVGNCIGRRNYRTFFLFIVSSTVLCCWVIAVCVLQLWDAAEDRDGNWTKAIGRYPASLILIIYAFLAVWFVGGLSSFHIWLISRNCSTYEHFRHRHSDAGNPYSRGILSNCSEALCWRTPPHFKALWEKQRQEDSVARVGEPTLTFSPMDGSVPPSIDGRSNSMEGGESSQGKADYGHLDIESHHGGIEMMQNSPMWTAAESGIELHGLGGGGAAGAAGDNAMHGAPPLLVQSEVDVSPRVVGSNDNDVENGYGLQSPRKGIE